MAQSLAKLHANILAEQGGNKKKTLNFHSLAVRQELTGLLVMRLTLCSAPLFCRRFAQDVA